MTTIINDIKYGFRQLLKRPGFAVAAMLTLALGLTVNGVVFSTISDFYLRPLPVVNNPDELVVVAQKSPKFPFAFPNSYPDFLDFRKAVEDANSTSGLAHSLSGIMAFTEQPVHLSRTNEVTEHTWVHLVSNNYFSVLGVQPMVGRFFLPSEGSHDGEDPVLVLSHRIWQKRFGANPGIVGESIQLNGKPFTVIGITPPGFHGASFGVDISGFMLASMFETISPGNHMIKGRGDNRFFLMGRLRPNVAFQQARKEVGHFLSQLVATYPDHHAQKVRAVVMREQMSRPSPFVASFAPVIVTVLMGLASLVLLVAIANVANLLFARAADQQREVAIRSALGASRIRLLRQLLIESTLLALGAGTIGVTLMLWLKPYLDGLAPTPTAPFVELGIDWRLFVFTFFAALATGILTGLLPALKATRVHIVPLLKEGTRSVLNMRHPWRSVMVSTQVAISVVILVCAGLAVRSLYRLSQVPLGFQPDHILMTSFDLKLQNYNQEQGRRFQTRLLEQVRSLPGVRHATLATHAPFSVGGGTRGDIKPEGEKQRREDHFEFVSCIGVESSFMKTMEIPVHEGRTFQPHDDKDSQRVAIINRILADNLWPQGEALGRNVLIGNRPHQVIGIMGACRYYSITDKNRPMVFRCLAQNYSGHLTLMIRSTGSTIPLRSAIEQIVRRLDPDLPLYKIQTMDQQIASSPLALMPMRMGATMAGIQGLLALLLAALGITALVSFAVTQRTREIGIRMALGAQTTDVLRLVTKQSLRLTLIGLGIGLVISLGIAHLLTRLLYRVSPTDPIVFISVILVIVGTATLACIIPARRAAKTIPTEALRYE